MTTPVPNPHPKSRLRAFWDYFVLFSGISTASNLSRTRRRPILTRGIFLFRQPGQDEPPPPRDVRARPTW